MDNYATHKTEAAGSPNARAGMSTTPRRPPRGQVERFFGLLTEKQLRRGVHQSTADLDQATVNDNPKPFRWTGGRNFDSTVLPANAGNRPGSGHKCTNFGIRTLGKLHYACGENRIKEQPLDLFADRDPVRQPAALCDFRQQQGRFGDSASSAPGTTGLQVGTIRTKGLPSASPCARFRSRFLQSTLGRDRLPGSCRTCGRLRRRQQFPLRLEPFEKYRV